MGHGIDVIKIVIGIVFVVIGVFVLYIGYEDYHRISHQIARGISSLFKQNSSPDTDVIKMIAGGVIILVGIILIWNSREQL